MSLAAPVSRPASALMLMDLLSAPSQADGSLLAGLTPAARAELAAQARAQRVLAPLVLALEHAGHKVPPELARPGRAAMARALALQAEALRLHMMLDGAGIVHCFLKGVVLAGQVYPVPWARPMRDIDILLAPEDLTRAHALLAAAGGMMTKHAHRDQIEMEDGAKHLAPLWSPSRLIGVELHGHAIGAVCGIAPQARSDLNAALLAGPVQQQGQSWRVGGHSLPCPGPEAMLVHLIIHGVHDHELNNGPILICDMLHLLRTNPPDPERLTALVDRLEIGCAMAMALSLLPDAMIKQAGLAQLSAAGPALPRETAVALLFQVADQRDELRLAADMEQSGPVARLLMLARRALPARHTMLDRWNMEKGAAPPPKLWPVFWSWFLRTRWRQMRARNAGVDRDSGAMDPRDHLLRLRALRDGTG